MASVLLSAKGIEIRFGGVIAADGIDLDVHRGRESRHHRTRTAPARPRSSTSRPATSGRRPAPSAFSASDITAQLPRTITKLGIARAFQIPQLFLDQTVMENMLIAAASLQGSPVGASGALEHAGEAGDGAAAGSRGRQGHTRSAKRENYPKGSASSSISLLRSP